MGLSYLICTYPHFIILIDKPVLFYSSQLYTSLVLLHGYVKEITHTGLARYSDNCAVNTEHGVQKSGLSYARSRELVDKKIIGKDLPAAMLNCSFYPLAAMLPSKSYSYWSYMYCLFLFSTNSCKVFNFNFWFCEAISSYLRPSLGTNLSWLVFYVYKAPTNNEKYFYTYLAVLAYKIFKRRIGLKAWRYALYSLLLLKNLKPFTMCIKYLVELTPEIRLTRQLRGIKSLCKLLFKLGYQLNLLVGYSLLVSGRLIQGRAAKKKRLKIKHGKYSLSTKSQGFIYEKCVLRISSGIVGLEIRIFF